MNNIKFCITILILLFLAGCSFAQDYFYNMPDTTLISRDTTSIYMPKMKMKYYIGFKLTDTDSIIFYVPPHFRNKAILQARGYSRFEGRSLTPFETPIMPPTRAENYRHDYKPKTKITIKYYFNR